MLKVLRSWSAGKLFASWIVYWVGLVGIGLGPAIAAMVRASNAAKDQASVAVDFNGSVFTLKVLNTGVTTYSGSIHLLSLALLVAGPPLLIWVLWLASRSKRSIPDAVGH